MYLQYHLSKRRSGHMRAGLNMSINADPCVNMAMPRMLQSMAASCGCAEGAETAPNNKAGWDMRRRPAVPHLTGS